MNDVAAGEDVVWLTYEELGARLGVAPSSALRRAMRGRWDRRRDPDGEARCAVPVAVLHDAIAAILPPADAPPTKSPDPLVSLAYLHSRLEAFEKAFYAEPHSRSAEQARWSQERMELRDAKARAEGGLESVLRVVEIQAAGRRLGAV